MVTVTMSLSMKINLGNYESADAFLSVSGIEETTTQEDVERVLDGPARIVYDQLKQQLGEKIHALRAGKGV